MAETSVENQVCGACGADVRKDALFCYNCGGAVASEIAVVKSDENGRADNAQSQESVFTKNKKAVGIKKKKIKEEIEENFVEETSDEPIEESSFDKETKLQSAAAMRGKIKSIQPKKVEIIWEEHENTPNVWFIAVTIFLTILAAVVLFLAMRLK